MLIWPASFSRTAANFELSERIESQKLLLPLQFMKPELKWSRRGSTFWGFRCKS